MGDLELLKWNNAIGVECDLRRCEAYGSYKFYVATVAACLNANPRARAEVLKALKGGTRKS